MTVYNYENLTYRFTGGSVINTKNQQGILMHLQRITDNKEIDIFMNKRDLAHLAKFTQTGRKYWKRFRLPKMVEQ